MKKPSVFWIAAWLTLIAGAFGMYGCGSSTTTTTKFTITGSGS